MAIGNQPSLTGNVASKTISITATASQTLFTVTGGYRINQLSVYRNGTRLVDSLDYTARDGSSVTLLSPATLYDVLEFQVFDDFRVADALNVNSGGTVNGNITVTGIVSATSFVGTLTGNATGLSGTPNITVGIVTATEFDITGSSNTLNASGLNVGVATATTFVGALTGTASSTTNIPNLTGAITSVNTTTSLGSFTSSQLATALTDETGSGANVFATSPTLVTPVLGTPSSGTLTNCTFPTLNQNTSGTAGGLSGSPNITVGNIVGTAATLTTLSGTSGLVSVGTTIKVKGFVETQSTVSIAGTILTLDASQGTVFTHTTSAQIGIVSFTGIRTDSAGAQTFSVLVTQGATPRNTTGATGIGTQLASIRITPGNVGYSTHIKVGGGTSITLTDSAGAFDLLTFIVSYDGNTSIGNTSFTVVGFAATDFRNTVV